MRRLKTLTLIAVMTVAATAAAAAPSADDYRRLNLDLVDHHILPRYVRLADAAAALERSTEGYCTTPMGTTPAELDQAWQTTVDAWQSAQHLRFGPVELFMRGMRIAFWPDPRNSVGRQLDELLASGDPAALEPDRFAHGSIATQGLPAFERLLHDATPARSDADRAFRCAAMQAIAHNVADMTAGMLSDWRDGNDGFREIIRRAGEPGVHYHTPREATLDLFKSLHAALEVVADHKLKRPLGDSLQAARPQLAESWRSERSLDNVRLNLAAAEALYLGEDPQSEGGFSHFVRTTAGDTALDDLLRRAFKQTRATAQSIGMPLERAVADPAERRKVEKLAREAAALKALLAQRLAPALGIPVGFNALDGD
ncbi:MAG: imelysin family protein [Chromatiales bacterium]|jgi:predicted lipoprotein|nr:imelysin family protein [Chromatiales bacterium]MDX9766422.1 imelysin family protein [Ectothiorhodospiraceae bacterium]